MENIWVLAADTSRARIFETSKRTELEKEIQTLAHPEGRQHSQDLVEDRPGKSVNPSKSESRVTYVPQSDPKKHAASQFAKEVAGILNKAANENTFDRLHILAPPEFLGMIRNEMTAGTQKKVRGELDKNVAQLKMEEIRGYLPDYL